MTRILYSVVSLGLILGICLGFLGALHPAFDTLAQFRWHFALAMIVWALAGIIINVRRVPLILIFFAALGVWQSGAGNRMVLQFPQDNTDAKEIQSPRLSLLHYNLRFDNPFKDAVLEMIINTNADLVSLGETSSQWAPKLELLKSVYPYNFHCPEWQAIGGTMLFSKIPMRSDKNYCHDYAALGITEVELAGKWIEIGIVHMRWPWPASGPAQLQAIEPRLATIHADALVVGDFNAATWSHAVRKFAKTSGMSVAEGFGGTWMLGLFPTTLAPFFGLPIDNVMAKGSVRIRSVKTLPAIGSDHLPLLVEFIN